MRVHAFFASLRRLPEGEYLRLRLNFAAEEDSFLRKIFHIVQILENGKNIVLSSEEA